MRSGWLALCVCLALLAGCRSRQRPVARVVPQVADAVCDTLSVPCPCEIPYNCIVVPMPGVGDPRQTLDPRSNAPWNLSLAEATRIAYENSEVVRVLVGETATVAAATTYDPGIESTGVQTALSAFDASVGLGMFWERRDQPPSLAAEGAFLRREQLDRARFNSFYVKPLLTGGQVGVLFDTDYDFFFPQTPLDLRFTNPQYFSPLTFTVTQPLLRGAGRDVNYAPTLIARAQADQSAWEFKDAMLAMARSVEEAYWDLYAAEVELESFNAIVPLYAEIVRVGKAQARQEATAEVNVAQAETRYFEVLRQQIESRNVVISQAARLRNVLGLPPEDARPIVLTSTPFRGEMLIDWNETIATAMDQRPDIVQERLAIYVRQKESLIARNSYRAQLDVGGFWRINGLGSDLNEAIDLLSTNRFADWNLGFQLTVPLGRREAEAAIRAATLSLRRQRALLDQTSHSATHEIAQILRDMDSLFEQIEVATGYREVAAKWRDGARARYFTPAGGISVLAALNSYLQAIRSWADAKQELANLIAEYNIAIARLGEAKGTLLETTETRVYGDPVMSARRFLESEPIPRIARPVIRREPRAEPILPPVMQPQVATRQPADLQRVVPPRAQQPAATAEPPAQVSSPSPPLVRMESSSPPPVRAESPPPSIARHPAAPVVEPRPVSPHTASQAPSRLNGIFEPARRPAPALVRPVPDVRAATPPRTVARRQPPAATAAPRVPAASTPMPYGRAAGPSKPPVNQQPMVTAVPQAPIAGKRALKRRSAHSLKIFTNRAPVAKRNPFVEPSVEPKTARSAVRPRQRGVDLTRGLNRAANSPIVLPEGSALETLRTVPPTRRAPIELSLNSATAKSASSPPARSQKTSISGLRRAIPLAIRPSRPSADNAPAPLRRLRLPGSAGDREKYERPVLQTRPVGGNRPWLAFARGRRPEESPHDPNSTRKPESPIIRSTHATPTSKPVLSAPTRLPQVGRAPVVRPTGHIEPQSDRVGPRARPSVQRPRRGVLYWR